MGFSAGAICDALNDRRAQHDFSQLCYGALPQAFLIGDCLDDGTVARLASWEEGTKSEEAEASEVEAHSLQSTSLYTPPRDLFLTFGGVKASGIYHSKIISKSVKSRS